MRRTVSFMSTRSLAWQISGEGGIATRVLNDDPVTGDRTVLLRAPPRVVTEAGRRRSHYHLGGEEFLSLGHPFTFDGNIWHRRLDYSFIPPGTVHGSDVRVPDGYLLYLRTSGPTEPKFVSATGAPPRPPATTAAAIRVAAPDAAGWRSAAAPSAASRYELRCDPATGDAAFLVRLPADFAGPIPGERSTGQYEILVVTGRFAAVDGTICRSLWYACGDADVFAGPVKAERETLLLVNTIGARRVRD